MGAPPSVLVLGIGNLLWADEGFGVRAVEALHRDYEFPPNVTLMDGGTQGIYLVQHIQAARVLVVFDAIDYGLAPGTLKRVEGDAVPKFLGAKKMSLHQTGFQEVLAMAEMLACIPHHSPTTAADPLALTGRTHSSRLDVVAATPAPSSAPCVPPERRFDALATNSGENCTLGTYPEHLLLIGVQPVELDDYGGSLRPQVKAQIQPAIEVALDYLRGFGIAATRRQSPLATNASVLDMHNYETRRPSETEACRGGDARVLFGDGFEVAPRSASVGDGAIGVDVGARGKS